MREGTTELCCTVVTPCHTVLHHVTQCCTVSHRVTHVAPAHTVFPWVTPCCAGLHLVTLCCTWLHCFTFLCELYTHILKSTMAWPSERMPLLCRLHRATPCRTRSHRCSLYPGTPTARVVVHGVTLGCTGSHRVIMCCMVSNWVTLLHHVSPGYTGDRVALCPTVLHHVTPCHTMLHRVTPC